MGGPFLHNVEVSTRPGQLQKQAFKGSHRTERPAPKYDEIAELHDGEDPDEDDVPSEIVDLENEDAFPYVPNRRIEKGEQISKSASITDRGERRNRLSTGVQRGSSRTAPAEFTPASSSGDPRVPGTLPFFRKTLSAIEQLSHETDLDVTISAETRDVRWPPAFGDRLGWAFVTDEQDGSRRRRRAIVARLIFGEQNATLIEFERNGLEQHALWCVRERGYDLLPYSVIERIMWIAAKNRGSLKEHWSEKGLDVDFERFPIKHCAKTPSEFAHAILRSLQKNAGIDTTLMRPPKDEKP